MKTKLGELLEECVSGLKAHGGEATADTVARVEAVLSKLEALDPEAWWMPVVTDRAWCDKKRQEYDRPGDSDDEIRAAYADGDRYQTLWDHVGEAKEEHEKLADAFRELLNASQ